MCHYTKFGFAAQIMKSGLNASDGGFDKGWFFSHYSPVDQTSKGWSFDAWLRSLGLVGACDLWETYYESFGRKQLKCNYGEDVQNREENVEVCLVFCVPKKLLRKVDFRDGGFYIKQGDLDKDVLGPEYLLRALLLDPKLSVDGVLAGPSACPFEENEPLLWMDPSEPKAPPKEVSFLFARDDGTCMIEHGKGDKCINFPVKMENLKQIQVSSCAHPWIYQTFGYSLHTQSDPCERTMHVLKDADVNLLYFSAHWCPPCRGFTAELARYYKLAMEQGLKVRVVFVSQDNSKASFDEYFYGGADVKFKTLKDGMPWHAIPYEDKDRRESLTSEFEVEGFPTLVALDGSTGQVLERNVVTKMWSQGWTFEDLLVDYGKIERRSAPAQKGRGKVGHDVQAQAKAKAGASCADALRTYAGAYKAHPSEVIGLLNEAVEKALQAGLMPAQSEELDTCLALIKKHIETEKRSKIMDVKKKLHDRLIALADSQLLQDLEEAFEEAKAAGITEHDTEDLAIADAVVNAIYEVEDEDEEEDDTPVQQKAQAALPIFLRIRGKSQQIDGLYELNESTSWNRYPVWIKRTQNDAYVIYTNNQGRWAVTTAANVEENRNFMLTSQPHQGDLPNQCRWAACKGNQYLILSGVTVVEERQATPQPCLIDFDPFEASFDPMMMLLGSRFPTSGPHLGYSGF